MTLDVSANYVKQNDRNMVNQGTYSNPLVTAYLFPRGDDWNDIKMYERYDTTRKIYTQYWPQDFSGLTGQAFQVVYVLIIRIPDIPANYMQPVMKFW